MKIINIIMQVDQYIRQIGEMINIMKKKNIFGRMAYLLRDWKDDKMHGNEEFCTNKG